MRHYFAAAFCVLTMYIGIIGFFTRAMGEKPYVEKLGLVASPKVLEILFGDYKEVLSASILSKVIVYYGSLTGGLDEPGKIIYAADYPAMSRTVHAALRLDPYNMDGYYFGQAILAWDARQYQLASDLLEYGMQHRTWDWQLPFFAGFNYAYFLGDKEKAAQMYMRAGELSGSALFNKLAGRYLQESGQTQMAIDYLQTMLKGAHNPAVKKSLQVRIEAFQAVLLIEQARDRYKSVKGRAPGAIEELVADGFLDTLPPDPYGGRFYFDKNQQVHTTSKFAFSSTPDSSDSTP